MIQGDLSKRNIMLCQIGMDLVLTAVRSGQDILLRFMLADHIQQSLRAAVSGKEYFPLPVQDKFLQIERYRFGDAAVFHLLAHLYLQLLHNAEEMVHGTSAGE